MKVLVATDGSKDATTAISTVSRLLRADANQFSLLCVAPDLVVPRPARKKPQREERAYVDQYKQQISQEANRILDGARASFKENGVEAEGIVEFGSPADVIVRLSNDFDLTVVGAHGRYERTQPGLGPVAGQVVEHSDSAVLVARDLVAERSFRVLAGVDGSLASEHALRGLAAAFNVRAAEITLMQVIEMPWVTLGLEEEWFEYPESVEKLVDSTEPQIRLERTMRMEAEEVIDDARSILGEYELPAATIIAEGNPALEMLSEAETGEYDLIVMGATGQANLKHTLLGSVSAKVARNAPCSVAVFRYRP